MSNRFRGLDVSALRSADKPERRVRVFVIGLLAMVGAWLAAVTVFGEWGADWWHISIWLWGLALIAVVSVGLWAFGWLRFPVANWMLWVLVIYFLLSAGAGAYFTEAATNGGIPRSATAQEHTDQKYDDNYRYSRAGGFYYYYIYSGSYAPSESSGSSTTSCSGKSCGGLALVIVLLVLLLASALIPHFWVIATLCGIVLWLLAFRREMLAPSEARVLERQSGAWVDDLDDV